MTDRLVSLRLLNVTRDKKDGCEWAKSYTPCVAGEPVKPWHKALEIQPDHDVAQVIYLERATNDRPGDAAPVAPRNGGRVRQSPGSRRLL